MQGGQGCGASHSAASGWAAGITPAMQRRRAARLRDCCGLLTLHIKVDQGRFQQCCHIRQQFTLLQRVAKIKNIEAPQVRTPPVGGTQQCSHTHRASTRHPGQQIRVQWLSASCEPPFLIACTPAPGPACTSRDNRAGLLFRALAAAPGRRAAAVGATRLPSGVLIPPFPSHICYNHLARASMCSKMHITSSSPRFSELILAATSPLNI